jgi:DNA-binding CsgD family transcriptional regulator
MLAIEQARRAACALVDSSGAAFVTALDGTVVAWNDGAASLLGVPAEAAIGQKCWKLVRGTGPDGRPVCHERCAGLEMARGGFADLVDALVPIGGPAAAAADPGTRRHFLMSSLVLRDPDGTAPAAVRHSVHDLPSLRAGLTRRMIEMQTGSAVLHSLTRRERQVLEVLAEGLSTARIAEQLGIRTSTARNHIQRILDKLEVSNRGAAIAMVLGALPASRSQPKLPRRGR